MVEFLGWGVIGIIAAVDSYSHHKDIGWALLAWIGWPVYLIYRMWDNAKNRTVPDPIDVGIGIVVKDTYNRYKKKKDAIADASIKELGNTKAQLLKQKKALEKEIQKLEGKK